MVSPRRAIRSIADCLSQIPHIPYAPCNTARRPCRRLQSHLASPQRSLACFVFTHSWNRNSIRKLDPRLPRLRPRKTIMIGSANARHASSPFAATVTIHGMGRLHVPCHRQRLSCKNIWLPKEPNGLVSNVGTAGNSSREWSRSGKSRRQTRTGSTSLHAHVLGVRQGSTRAPGAII